MSPVAYPFDGPHTPDTVKAAASDVADLVRYLANATRRGDSLNDPADLALVVGRLNAALAGLPQILDQLAAHAARYATRRGLYDSHGDNPAGVAGDANLRLRAAARVLPIAVKELAAAHEAVSRLGIDERNP